MIYSLGGKKVMLNGKNHFIAENATILGAVTLEDKVSIWFGAIIRGDDEIRIGENTNIQDGAVLHTDPGKGMTIGKNVTIGHRAVMHGFEIGDNTLIGINAVILDGVTIGKNCIISANTLVTEGSVIPDNSVVMGSPGKIVKEVKPNHEKLLLRLANAYVENLAYYRKGLKKQVL